MDNQYLSTRAVCTHLSLTEPALRHVLRRPGAPRPSLHPTARVFLWTEGDLLALREFLAASTTLGSVRQGDAESSP